MIWIWIFTRKIVLPSYLVWLLKSNSYISLLFNWVMTPLKLLKDQKRDTHLCSNRSESCLKCMVLQTSLFFSVDNLFVSTTLTTLIIVHITSIFIFPYLFHVKLNVYAGLLCKNISESKLYVLRTSYWWDIRAIYIHYFEIFDVNIVNRWLWYPTSN